MKNPQIRSRYAGIILLLLCPLAALLILYHPNDYAVSKTSHQLIKASGNWIPLPLAGGIPYQWVDNNNIIIQSRTYGPTIIDATTDQKTPLLRKPIGSIMKYFNQTHIDNWAMSPDSKWLLSPIRTSGFNWALFRRDLSQALVIPSYPTPFNFPIIWSRDSKHWYRFTFVKGKMALQRYSIDINDPLDIIPIKSADERRNGFFSTYELIGETDKKQLLCISWKPNANNSSVDAIIYDISKEPPLNGKGNYVAIPHVKSIQAPKGARLIEVELSPKGNRLAWIFDFQQNSTGFNIGKLHPATMGAELWVSDIEGENMHPVCIDNNPNEGPKSVRWKPDNEHVTFIYRGYLYEADAH